MPLHYKSIALAYFILWSCLSSGQNIVGSGELSLFFSDNDIHSFNDEEQFQIRRIIERSEQGVRSLLPGLPLQIKVTIMPIDRDLRDVGGVTGRADTANEVVVYISTLYEGGISAAAQTGLAATIYHEFHHLARGWTIEGNKFGPGIVTAAINEGLANVFSETYTKTAFEGNAYPNDVKEWFEEVLTLPLDANYNQWMNEHPDGRIAIGYRVGSYIIHQAMTATNRSILELSNISPDDILVLANRQ